MKKIIKIWLVITILFTSPSVIFAADVNLTIRDTDTIVFSGAIPLQIPPLPDGMIDLADSSFVTHSINANSVLSMLNDADLLSPDFSISNLEYYDSMGSFYLKCITDVVGERCDDWQYTVDNLYPPLGMDKTILIGGENVYVYFGPQHRLSLSSASINASETLTVTTENYDYQNNSWIIRTGVTVGLTQPDPNNPWSPIEIRTSAVDANGQVIFSGIPEGSYNVGIQEDFYFPTETLTVTTPPAPVHHSSSGSYISPIIIETIVKQTFDTKKAFEFLSSQQKENGSFGEEIYTDWAAIAFGSNADNQDQKNKLIKYLSENKLTGENLTDYERRSIALMTLGLNPYNIYPDIGGANNENYIEKIVKNFDGIQFGNINEDNDDIFALIVLQNAGFKQDEKIITDTINFILSKQKENGSWDESIDMTGAGIEALSIYKEKQEVKIALDKAKEYLKQNQKDDGSWSNVSSTAWAIEGILALGEKIEDWKKNENTPIDYFALNQDIDGGIKNENLQNKIWQTSYVLTSLSDKTWNEIMKKFEKEDIKAPQIIPERDYSLQRDSSHKIEFIKKISKFQKINTIKTEEAAKIDENQIKENISEIPKKENWFRRFINKILSIF
ncbi:MAG: prenyltransferase/squalene oxidase repeat-containing protein [Minisyncoccia bacterium]